MAKVTGIGGVFFKAEDPASLKTWYGEKLGLPVTPWGASFFWRAWEGSEERCRTEWSAMDESTKYLDPSTKPFMINYRVDNLVELLDELRAAGVAVIGEIDEQPYGKFGWVMDPEGNKIELWEPNEAGFEGG